MSLPFTAVVGQDDAKLALLLAAVEPRLGGVLLRGDKGSAKTTLARGLAALLGDAPFVELPLGASEDRVVGSLDLAALFEKQAVLRPGLLGAAHGGVLYVDEVNLLADHLVDTLLDVAVSGVNRVERDGVSATHDARFVLVGSMNPEEGELRPQLLDRFGLAVDVRASTDPAERALAVTRQLAADDGAPADEEALGALAARLASSRPAAVPPEVVDAASRLAVAVDAQGLRADLSLCRAASALAGWEGRSSAELDDLRRVAHLVLGHRRRRNPFEEPGMQREQLDQALDDALDPPQAEPGDDGPDSPQAELGDDARRSPRREPPVGDRSSASSRVGDLAIRPGDTPLTAPPAERSRPVPSARGRQVGDAPLTAPGQRLAPVATVLAARGETPRPDDLRAAVTVAPRTRLVVVAVDASGSMAGRRRVELARRTVLGLLADAYRTRDRVALVAFAGERADVVLRPTGSVEVARTRLADVATGGTTPLAAGIDAVTDLVRSAGDDVEPVVVLITDGRATAGGDDPVAAAHRAASRLAATGARCRLFDAEEGPVRLGLAAELAVALGAEHVPLADLEAGAAWARP